MSGSTYTLTPTSLQLAGEFSLEGAGAFWRELSRDLRALSHGARFEVDLSQVSVVDGGTVALLVQLGRDLERRGTTLSFFGARAEVQALLELYRANEPRGRPRVRATPMLAQLGAATLAVVDELKQVFAFVWQVLSATVGAVLTPKHANWRAVPRLMEVAGADAVPIVALINLLVGFVMGYQSAAQLKQFGANLYVADLVGLSLTRELGPLMTAIILSGRSGAAFAAELGSMKVNEEIDALRTLGLDPVGFLVLPRAVALVAVAPLLTLLGDALGVVGGLGVAVTSLGLTPMGYLTELREAVGFWDVGSGLFKSVLFAVVVAVISCQQGLATQNGAQGVGERTTSSVVASLFTLILVDAGATMAFHAIDQATR